MRRWLLAIFVLCLVPTPALAWGDQGHHLTCQIAYGSLTPRARQEVDRLLATQAPKYRQFGRSCTYPDKVKDIDGRRALHFVNLRRQDVNLPGLVCPVATASAACLLGAIEDDYALLRDGQSSDTDRAKALMYLGHWIGDLHQPLHISFKDDIGGNSIQTAGLCTYRGNPSKLHSIWDTCIIVQRIFAQAARRDMIDDPRFYRASDDLRESVAAGEASGWRQGAPWNWPNESYAISRQGSTQYCILCSGACRYDDARLTLPYRGDQRSVDIDDAYVDAFAPVVRERLQRGGIRLEHLINQAFDREYR